jgi:pimeloyl-ACP methyl ester carboxylesterase
LTGANSVNEDEGVPIAQGNGIEIAYETTGDAAGDPLLLVMGFAAQLVAWDDEFCENLADRGFYVIRFDNRDTGLSTKFDGAPGPSLLTAYVRSYTRRRVRAPYTLGDMADDAFGLLDWLKIDRAHVVGVSMGGMIAQRMALSRPDRVLSLTSIMSTTGNRAVGTAKPQTIALLLTPPRPDREGYIEDTVEVSRAVNGSGVPFAEDRARARAGRAWDRCYHPASGVRHMLAVLASGDLTRALKGMQVPTLVIHGARDPLVDPSGGRATAAAVPNAELLVVPEMGHALAPAVWPTIIDAVADHAAGRGTSDHDGEGEAVRP